MYDFFSFHVKLMAKFVLSVDRPNTIILCLEGPVACLTTN